MLSASCLTTSGKAAKSLDAGVPILLLHRGYERLVFQVLVLGQPLLQLNDLERISGGHQRLAEQRIGIQRDGRHQRIELVGRDLGSSLIGRRGWLGLHS